MLQIPFSDKAGTYKIFVILEESNIDRLREYDPAEIQFMLPGFESHKLTGIFIGYVKPEDHDRIIAMAQEPDGIKAIIELLNKGWRFRPEAGDHDGPPMSVRSAGEKKH